MAKPSDEIVITRGNPKCPAAAQAGPAPTLAGLKAAANATITAKAGGVSVDVGAGLAGVKRGVESAVQAKLSTANWTVTTWANALRNKTGGVV